MSESEFERLYREFVAKNGGIPTLVGEQYNTPASYYSDNSGISLSPSELASLQQKQQQFNRQYALNTISSEIASNNFSNPYDSRSQLTKSRINEMTTEDAYSDIVNIRSGLESMSSEDRLLFVNSVKNQTGVDLEKLSLLPVLTETGTNTYNDLQTHTNSQATNIPGKIQEIEQLVNLNRNFGESPVDSCSPFNELMGILAGTFDGVMDFVDEGLSSILNMLKTIGKGVLGVVAGAIGAVTTVVEKLLEIPIIKDLANMISSVVSAVGSIAEQLVKEIAGAVNMAADIAKKLEALAIAGAMADPCKLAVLMNTGTPALADAASKLNAPFDAGKPTFDIPLETDPRADRNTVSRAVQQAERVAQASPGVPQSPISDIGKLYQPFNSYLFDLVSLSDGIFGSTYELVKSDSNAADVVNRISATSENNPVMTDFSNISSQLRGTIGDISNNIGSLSTGMPVNTNEWSDNITDVDPESSSDDFEIGGATNISIAGDNSSRILPRRRQVERSIAEISTPTRIVRETTAEGTTISVEGPSKQIASARTLWNKRYKSSYGRIIRDVNKILKEARTYLSTATFREESIRRETQILYDTLQDLKSEVMKFQKSETKKFEYTSRNQDRDKNIENDILNTYNTVMINQNDVMLSRTTNELNTLSSTWNSLKAQAILPSSGTSRTLG